MTFTERGIGACQAALIGTAAMLSGCARYDSRPLDPVASAQAVQARSLANPDLVRFVGRYLEEPGSPVRWNLNSLTAAAIYERPEMKVAAGQVRAAQAGERSAAEWPNPVLSIAPTYDSTLVAPSPWKIGPVITELVRTAGKRSAGIAEARERTQAARQRLAIAAWQLRDQVRTALIDLWAARRRLALSRGYDAAAQQVTALVLERHEAGAVSAAALTSQQLTGMQAAVGLATAERQARLATAALATAVGVPEQAVEAVPIDLSELEQIQGIDDKGLGRERALTQRPEILAALARYDAAQAALRLEVARQYPDLNIGPGYEYDQGENKFIFGISLPLPVLNQNQGPIAAARAARQVAAAEFDQVQTAVLGQIDTAEADWRASQAEAGQTQRLLHLAARVVDTDRTAFKAGQIGRLQLAGAELAQAQAELGALTASIDERVALGRLEDAFHEPLIGISGKR